MAQNMCDDDAFMVSLDAQSNETYAEIVYTDEARTDGVTGGICYLASEVCYRRIWRLTHGENRFGRCVIPLSPVYLTSRFPAPQYWQRKGCRS